MTIYDIIRNYLEEHGHDGLCFPEEGCGCARFSCIEPSVNCQIAKKHVVTLADHEAELYLEFDIGDEIFVPVELELVPSPPPPTYEEKFVRHIEEHLKGDQVVICTICGKDIIEIAGKPSTPRPEVKMEIKYIIKEPDYKRMWEELRILWGNAIFGKIRTLNEYMDDIEYPHDIQEL